MSLKKTGAEPLSREPQMTEPKWYAVYTTSRAEKQIFERLKGEGIETFLPLQKTYRKWSDRKKLVIVPLIPSYLFVKIRLNEAHKVYMTHGVVRFITFEGTPAPIPQKQIDNLKILIDSDAEIEVTSEQYSSGDHVEVTMGSLVGLTGELIKVGNQNRVVVRLDRLDQNIVVKIPVTFLRKI